MCNLYSDLSAPDWIKINTDFAGSDWQIPAGNKEPLPAIFPDGVASVARATPKGRELVKMRWGFPVPGPRPGEKKKPGYQTNIRQPNWAHWRPWMEPKYRCLVPVTSFNEYRDDNKVPTWFALSEDRPLFFFAGVWMPWTGHRGTKASPADGDHLLYSFLTTKPNKEVAPVHAKAMPVILRAEAEWKTWLMGSVEEALALQRPAPDGTLKIVATGSRHDG